MAVAISLQQYLESRHIPFDCITHRRTDQASESAAASGVATDRLAKAVVLRHRDGYVMAVVPASRTLNIQDVGGWLKQPVALATENEIAPLFPDCDRGAIPPLGAAYGLRTLIDNELDTQDDIYFEAGDHETLVHVSGEAFKRLTRNEAHGRFCRNLDVSGTAAHYHGA